MPRCEVCGIKIQKGKRCIKHRYCLSCGANIQQGKWCPECAKKQKAASVQRYKEKHYHFRSARSEMKPERIERICLKCDRAFMAEGRFNRICPLCTKGNSDVLDPEMYGPVMR